MEQRINGFVAPGFEKVKKQFEQNFRSQGEQGAACAVWHKGKPVVDLWGGFRDIEKKLPWEEGTLVHVFSTSKGISSLAVALAAGRGYFSYDDLVAKHWPAFAQNGKAQITIRQLLAHQAGLSALDTKLDATIIAHQEQLSAILARQKPAWEVGAYQGYHCFSLGWYESELIRQTDPKQRTLGQFFQEEIAIPLGIEFYIGTPADIPEEQIAIINDYPPLRLLLHLDWISFKMMLPFFVPGSLPARTLGNPKLSRSGDMVRPPYRSVEIPAGNGIGTVRSMAKLYGMFAAKDKQLNLSQDIFKALAAKPQMPSKKKRDKILQIDTAYSLGFMKPFPKFRFGSGDHCYGTPGYGGSFAFADPQAEIGFAYAPTKMGFKQFGDPREKKLRDALYESLESI